MNWKIYARVLAAIAAALALMLLTTSMQSARAMPLSNSGCTGFCSATWDLGGRSVHGIGSDFTIDNPNTGSGELYEKWIETDTSGSSYQQAGVEKNGACGSGLWYFYFNDNVGNQCIKQVPSQDVNTTITIKLSYYASNGGGGFVYILSRSGSQCNPCGYADSGLTNVFTDTSRNAYMVSNAFTGHRIWGGEWANNRVFSNGSWSFESSEGGLTLRGSGNAVSLFTTQDSCGSYTGSVVPPHQMCWNTKPQNSSTGGVLYSCVYDSLTNSCTYGS